MKDFVVHRAVVHDLSMFIIQAAAVNGYDAVGEDALAWMIPGARSTGLQSKLSGWVSSCVVHTQIRCLSLAGISKD